LLPRILVLGGIIAAHLLAEYGRSSAPVPGGAAAPVGDWSAAGAVPVMPQNQRRRREQPQPWRGEPQDPGSDEWPAKSGKPPAVRPSTLVDVAGPGAACGRRLAARAPQHAGRE